MTIKENMHVFKIFRRLNIKYSVSVLRKIDVFWQVLKLHKLKTTDTRTL